LKDNLINWLLFVVLSVIWGSSFLLMKIGITVLQPFEVASLRILSAGIVLLPFAFRGFKDLPRNKLPYVILSGSLGSFLPAFLFCTAETKLDSALTGMLNSLTPLCAVIIGVLFFKMKTSFRKLLGILIGLVGLFFMISPNGNLHLNNTPSLLMVIAATILYAVNVNMVSRHLKGLIPIKIASVAFACHIIPCLSILIYTGYFSKPLLEKNYLKATFASCSLGIIGTAFATVLFYRLVSRSNALFAAMVTYGIPFVAAAWGILYGEQVTPIELGCLAIILAGVYLANN